MLPLDQTSPAFMKWDESGCEYKTGSINFCTPCGMWSDMATISLQQSNLSVAMATSFPRPAVSSMPHRQRCLWCTAHAMLLSAALCCLHWITGIMKQLLKESWREKGFGWGEQDGTRTEMWSCTHIAIWKKKNMTKAYKGLFWLVLDSFCE